jgi:hypothetical protein
MSPDGPTCEVCGELLVHCDHFEGKALRALLVVELRDGASPYGGVERVCRYCSSVVVGPHCVPHASDCLVDAALTAAGLDTAEKRDAAREAARFEAERRNREGKP